MKKLKLTENEIISLITNIISEQETSDLYDVLKQKYGFTETSDGVKFKLSKKLNYYDKKSNSQKVSSYIFVIQITNDGEYKTNVLLFVPPYKEQIINTLENTMSSLGSKVVEFEDGNYRDGFYTKIKFDGGNLNSEEFFKLITNIKNMLK
jgi:hypothetical protein